MSLPQVGSSYCFKTFAHYYLGEVVDVQPTHVVLKTASEVYETGPLADFYGHGRVRYCERLPDGWCVPFSGTAWGPFEHELPTEAIIPEGG